MSKKQPLQSPHWLDEVVQAIEEWQQQTGTELHVDDMKTPSGRVHTGSLRGVMLHDLVAQALSAHHHSVESTYIFNDMDPMDALPGYLDESVFSSHMGEPLYRIPAPPLAHSGINLSLLSEQDKQELQQAQSFAELYAVDFEQTFRRLGCQQTIIRSHELYESGQMDEAIKLALDNVAAIKRIYKEVADYQLPEHWYPFQVICPHCGKVGTTLVTAWDGQEVSFECQENKVKWATGCGYTGKISPFGGTGKLLWKVDWPAHWSTLGITMSFSIVSF